jgi:hypothetical protein
MNKTILSDIERSKEIYPIVLNEIRKCGQKMLSIFDLFDSDIDMKFENLLRKLVRKLHKITGKDIALIDSYIDDSWDTDWKEEDFEDLSFIISLSEPKIIENISQEEISEICKIVKGENYMVNAYDFIERRFFRYFNDYFQELLEINLQHLLQKHAAING